MKDLINADPRRRATGNEDCAELTTKTNASEVVTIASAHYHPDHGIWAIVLVRDGAEPTAFITGFGTGELFSEDGSYEDSPLNLLVDLLPRQWPLFVLNDELDMASDFWRRDYLAKLLANPVGWGISTGGLKEFLHDKLEGRKAEVEFDPSDRPISVKVMA
jgi:hypothetical protein